MCKLKLLTFLHNVFKAPFLVQADAADTHPGRFNSSLFTLSFLPPVVCRHSYG